MSTTGHWKHWCRGILCQTQIQSLRFADHWAYPQTGCLALSTKEETDVRPKRGVQYEVFSREEPNRLIVRGNSIDCYKALNITYAAFLTMICRSKCGLTEYIVNRIENPMPESWHDECIRLWDESFSWYRDQTILREYPCNGCMHRSICDYKDYHCKTWDEWFSEAYTKTARNIRRIAKWN